jgi:two-component system LytT family response regulator
MSDKINCVVADDEPLARKGIENFVKEIPFLNMVASCSNPISVMELLSKEKIDLIFLDVQMPKMTGIEFLRTVKNPPLTIITTAFPNYALEGFELDVMDYLIKPISFDRFIKAVNKAKEYFDILEQSTSSAKVEIDYFFIKCEKNFEKVFLNEIMFVEAMQNYVMIHTDKKRLITYVTLKTVEEYLPQAQFIKVSKSFIVPIQKIDSISGNEIKIGTHSIPIGRTIKEEVLNTLFKNKLLKRQ